jgi:putative membrane protein insertion efficiency factor
VAWASRPVLWLIRLYQRATSWLPPVCRFRPSCSEYAIQAIEGHGLWRGLGLALWRIMRCNPLCAGGDDPVPPGPKAADAVPPPNDNERTA